MDDKEFSEERLERLIRMLEPGADAYSARYREVSEVVSEILRETAKTGYKGDLKVALHRFGIAESTAWDMRMRHRVQIGEIPDPDAPDPRDEEEDPAQGKGESKGNTDKPTERVPCAPASSEAAPSALTAVPTEHRRRLLADFDDDDHPEPSGEGK